MRALCSSRSLGAPCGTFVCRESELKTCLFAGHSLGGRRFERIRARAVPWAVLVGVPWAVLVGAPRPRLGRSLGSPCRRTSSAPRAFLGQSSSAHLVRPSGAPCGCSLGAPCGRSMWVPHGRSLGHSFAGKASQKRLSGDRYVSLTPTALSFVRSLTWWAWL